MGRPSRPPRPGHVHARHRLPHRRSPATGWPDVDLEAGTVEITHTIARIPGEGLLRKTTKSRAGERVLSLPRWATSTLRARHAAGARRDLGESLKTLRRHTHMTCKQVAEHLGWPQTRVELIETGRIKADHQLIATLVGTYGIQLDNHHALLAQLHDAAQPAESDKLAWIRSHALRKTTATALDDAGHTARQIADQLGQSKVSITQDVYLGRRAANPAAAEALEHAFDDPELL
ncbi:helix-turn-helix domain-containing protein [Kribbella sp. NPDC050459]|uniref:helix-turn-helix domain-containing protein n=1 Tax=Kribbella sp. NPDC050459 TaxID=3155785 RepID=UPI0033CA47F6